jgi:hypothetical protein
MRPRFGQPRRATAFRLPPSDVDEVFQEVRERVGPRDAGEGIAPTTTGTISEAAAILKCRTAAAMEMKIHMCESSN